MSEAETIDGELPDVHCAECNTVLAEGNDCETTDAGVFCRSCYDHLTAQLRQAIEAQDKDVNYPMALIGGLLGAAIGILVWWGFTVLTQIAFGLVAVVIGITVAKGILILAGNKRAQGLQIMSTIIASIAFFYASYLVNRTFIHEAFVEEGRELVLPLLPGPQLFIEVLQVNFNFMDLIFLAIVVYEAWKIPAPIKLDAG